MFRASSPAHSSTSLSDNEDDDYNKSAFFTASDAYTIKPAQWTGHSAPQPADTSYRSPASRLPPEILIHILKHIHSSRDLYHALLVSRIWCQCSVELLWYRPTFPRLATLLKMMRVLSRHDQTFQYAQFIRRLNFLPVGQELSDSLLSRLAQCVRLERLTLINCHTISDDALTRVLRCCPNLAALDLTGVTEITDASIEALASSTKKLQGINLSGCKKLTDNSALALADNCPLLRRVKLSNVTSVTDEAVSALAKNCPLLLELDLNNCKLITDVSIRDVWAYSLRMRELRLSHCAELTDAAFPTPPRPELANPLAPNPFPSSSIPVADKLPPLRLTHDFDHLRMLDLTACAKITDDAIEGVISVAPKIRTLYLSKCTQLTDHAVENICKLGKHLHYLHLGHAGSLTDRSVRCLARSCMRLRYIDLTNCVQLTDMSVFELSSLQKLRRIGLVRVSSLTDQAIYALGERYATLERIHLSYCEQISVLAIHFLLQKLPKLEHLSLTGIPAFRRPELQQFCRAPPSEYNSAQRAGFCVYSGSGIVALRDYLMALFAQVTNEINEADETDYEDAVRHRHYRSHHGQAIDYENEDNDSGESIDTIIRHPHFVVSRGGFRTESVTILPDRTMQHESHARTIPPVLDSDLTMARERTYQPMQRSGGAPSPWSTGYQPHASDVSGQSRRARGFGQQPIIESSMSASPTPSDEASNRSGGTNQSSGTAFFRALGESSAAARPGVVTPDLVFAEIGHGRGADAGPSMVYAQSHRRSVDQPMAGPSHQSYSYIPVASTSHSATNAFRLPVTDSDMRTNYPYDPRQILVDSSNSYQHGYGSSAQPQAWNANHHEDDSQPISSSPTTQELHDSLQSALGSQPGFIDGREGEGRGRFMKRSLRNTFTAAEQYASSFLFGSRGSSGGGPDGAAGPAHARDSDTRGH